MQSIDWYFAPLLNPDGYEFSHTDDRMWRKNRSPPPSGSRCYGTDLNRNWDVIGFGAGATSSNPCAETYKAIFKSLFTSHFLPSGLGEKLRTRNKSSRRYYTKVQREHQNLLDLP